MTPLRIVQQFGSSQAGSTEGVSGPADEVSEFRMFALELDDVVVEPVAETIVILGFQGLGDLARELAGTVLTAATMEVEALGKLSELLSELVFHDDSVRNLGCCGRAQS